MVRESLGRHVLVEFFGCDPNVLNDVVTIERAMLRAAQEAGATIINSTFHHFSPFGVSGVVVVQESHLAIHTWPEYGYAAVDIFTCGEPVNPWKAYHYLMKTLKAESGAALEMHRGQLDILKKLPGWSEPQIGDSQPVLKPEISRNVWFTERHEYIAQSFRHKGDVLFRKKSKYQLVEVYDTYEYGRMLVLDGIVQLAEEYEFIYHESMVHPSMFIKPADPAHVLIIGGGDGGTAREVLRHENVQHVDLVEIDEVVIEASRKFFPAVSVGLNNEKLSIHIQNGLSFVASQRPEQYDYVYCDVSDPVGPSQGAFTSEFHRNVYRILKPGGIMVIQAESPFFREEVLSETFEMLQEIYGESNVHVYLANIPTYPTGTWSFIMACKDGIAHPVKTFDTERAKQFSRRHRLRYYDENVHVAAFTLPPFLKEFLGIEVEEKETV